MLQSHKRYHITTWGRARQEPSNRPRNPRINPLTLSAILVFFVSAWGERRGEGVGQGIVTVWMFSGTSFVCQHLYNRFDHEDNLPSSSSRSLTVPIALPPGCTEHLLLFCDCTGVGGTTGLPQLRSSSLNRSRTMVADGRFEGWEPCSTDQVLTNNPHN